MGFKRFCQHAQNLLGGVKKGEVKLELRGQKGCYYNYTKINYVVLIVLYCNYNTYIMLYFIIIYYYNYIMILLYCYIYNYYLLKYNYIRK